jgi:hypothetical protein
MGGREKEVEEAGGALFLGSEWRGETVDATLARL